MTNKFYTNFFWLKFKVILQDMQYFGQNKLETSIELTNVTVREIPLRGGLAPLRQSNVST